MKSFSWPIVLDMPIKKHTSAQSVAIGVPCVTFLSASGPTANLINLPQTEILDISAGSIGRNNELNL